MKSFRPFSTLVFLLSSFPAVAYAGPLATAVVGANNGEILECVVTNVGDVPTPITTVKFYNASGGALVAAYDTCTGQSLASHASCVVVAPEDTAASCVVNAKGKLRAGIEVYDPTHGNGIVAFVPATLD